MISIQQKKGKEVKMPKGIGGIQLVDKYKYLRIEISSKGTIAPHMESLKMKVANIQRAIGRLKGKGLYMMTSMDMYNAYLRPHLNMVTPALSFASKKVINDYLTKALGALKNAL